MQNSTNFTVNAGELIHFPLDQWSPESLIARSQNKEIPFRTDEHRNSVATFLINNKEEIQKIFDKTILKVKEIQNLVLFEMACKEITEKDNLTDEEANIVFPNLLRYVTALNQATWVLPAEGFTDFSKIPQGFPKPKCFGILK